MRYALLLAVALASGTATAQPFSIFVDQATGNDANDGLSPGTAVATVTRGVQLASVAGTVNIGPGTYSPATGEVYPLATSGAVDFLGAGAGMTILDGQMLSTVLQLSGLFHTLEDLTIRNGNSTVGGGIFVDEPLTLDMRQVHFEDCNASVGGGVYLQMNTRATDCFFLECRFERNTAAFGAATQFQINTGANVMLDVRDSTFAFNMASSAGGGIHLQENGTGSHLLEVSLCEFRSNGGGAIRFQRSAGAANAVIASSVFLGNDVGLDAVDSTVDLINCTFSGNSTGINTPSGRRVEVANCIFWGNTTEMVGSGFARALFNIVEGLAFGGFTDLGNNFSADPSLDANGRIAAFSAAIDQGNDTIAMIPGVLVDVDGDLRILDDPMTMNGPGGAVDLGADEFVPPPNCMTVCGDCNLLGTGPDILDALAAAQIAAGAPAVLQQLFCCDVDSSGAITVLDALLMAQSAAGLPVVPMCP